MADREEQYLNAIADGEAISLKPTSREERYLYAIANKEEINLKPIGRKERYLKAIADSNAGGGGGGGETDPEEEKSQLAGLIDGSLTELTIPDGVTKIANYALYYNMYIQSVQGYGDIEFIGDYAFGQCSKLTSVDIPNAKTLRSYAFYNIPNLISVNLPSVTSVENCVFQQCKALVDICMPQLGEITNNTFSGCSALTQVDLPSVTRIGISSCFASCYSLKRLILRNTTLCTIRNSPKSVFSSCYHYLGTVNSTYNPEGLKDGYIYVPRALLSDTDETMDYRRATNWVEFADRFRALEDYTVDGTTTGELDESKI
jgi:hypothetical protein